MMSVLGPVTPTSRGAVTLWYRTDSMIPVSRSVRTKAPRATCTAARPGAGAGVDSLARVLALRAITAPAMTTTANVTSRCLRGIGSLAGLSPPGESYGVFGLLTATRTLRAAESEVLRIRRMFKYCGLRFSAQKAACRRRVGPCHAQSVDLTPRRARSHRRRTDPASNPAHPQRRPLLRPMLRQVRTRTPDPHRSYRVPSVQNRRPGAQATRQRPSGDRGAVRIGITSKDMAGQPAHRTDPAICRPQVLSRAI